MTVKKTQQTLNATLEKTKQSLNGLETALENNVGAHPVRDAGDEEKGLPEGWIGAPIGEVAGIYNGRAFKQTEWAKTGLPIIRIQNLNKPTAMFNYFKGELDQRHLVHNGDLLFAWSGTPGTSFGAHEWKGGDAALNQHIFKIELNENCTSKIYFRYAMNHKLQEMIGNANGGVGLRHITKKTFETTLVSYPPLAEQTVIAQTLDTLLAQVDNIKTRLDAIQKILKTFRQSVLAAAVSGKLTEAWRGTEASDWQKKTLIDVVEDKPRNGKSPKGVDYKTEFKSLTLSAITPGYFVDDKFKYIELNISSESYLWVKYGDILIQRANSLEYVGVSAIYKGESNKYVYPDLIMKCSPNKLILGEYLHYSLSSQKVRQFFRNNATGTAGNMPKVNQQIVSAAPISLPSIEEQTEIVRRVEELFAFADQIEQQVKNAHGRVNNLTQSILAKAFRGELTTQWRAQNPDLISGENSAEVLLAKIQEEREKLKPKKAAKKKSTAKKRAKV